MSEAVATAQASTIGKALNKVIDRLPKPPKTFIISGQGEFLAKRAIAHELVGAHIVSLRQELGPKISRCAPAYGLAILASEASE